MLRLHGFPASNYHNVVKVVLLEKGLEFEEVVTYPPAAEAYRAKNPTGKYPCLEIEDGSFLGESKVIDFFVDHVADLYEVADAQSLGVRGRRGNAASRRGTPGC